VIDTSTLRDLYRHMEWADAAVWTSVLVCESGRTDAKLHDTLYHLHVVQRAFLRTWRNEPRETPYPTFDDAPSMMQWGRSYYPEAWAYLQNLSEGKLLEPIWVPWAAMVEQQLGRAPEATSIGETALQVVLHSLYHRGQINARLREVGGEPPLVDYIAWIWLGKLVADWPRVVSRSSPERSDLDGAPG
jgi:uncharacterized damage-inducible protein DinB